MPLYSIDKIGDEGFLALWEMAEEEEYFLENGSVPDEELKDILESPSPRRRLEKLAVRALLNECFEKRQYLGYEENNRPYLKNYSGDISISHASRFVCIVVHQNAYVGVDIEARHRDFSVVESKILTPYEASYVEDKHKDEQLCLIWCAKEAVYKAMHQQRVDFNRQIEIDKFSPKQQGKLSAKFINTDGTKIKLQLDYRIVEEFALAWVVR